MILRFKFLIALRGSWLPAFLVPTMQWVAMYSYIFMSLQDSRALRFTISPRRDNPVRKYMSWLQSSIVAHQYWRPLYLDPSSSTTSGAISLDPSCLWEPKIYIAHIFLMPFGPLDLFLLQHQPLHALFLSTLAPSCKFKINFWVNIILKIQLTDLYVSCSLHSHVQGCIYMVCFDDIRV